MTGWHKCPFGSVIIRFYQQIFVICRATACVIERFPARKFYIYDFQKDSRHRATCIEVGTNKTSCSRGPPTCIMHKGQFLQGGNFGWFASSFYSRAQILKIFHSTSKITSFTSHPLTSQLTTAPAGAIERCRWDAMGCHRGAREWVLGLFAGQEMRLQQRARCHKHSGGAGSRRQNAAEHFRLQLVSPL